MFPSLHGKLDVAVDAVKTDQESAEIFRSPIRQGYQHTETSSEACTLLQ